MPVAPNGAKLLLISPCVSIPPAVLVRKGEAIRARIARKGQSGADAARPWLACASGGVGKLSVP
jgi:hypothetical protein